jgi:hypothetical protein
MLLGHLEAKGSHINYMAVVQGGPGGFELVTV